MKSEELLTYLMVIIVGYFIMIYSKCNIVIIAFEVIN